MPASMLMASLQAYLRVVLPESSAPAEVLRRLTPAVLPQYSSDEIRQPGRGARRAGRWRSDLRERRHHPPVLLRGKGGDGALTQLRPTGAAIGLVEHASFAEAHVVMEAGGLLIFYTDGVVEARDQEGREFRAGRVAREVRRRPQGDCRRAGSFAGCASIFRCSPRGSRCLTIPPSLALRRAG